MRHRPQASLASRLLVTLLSLALAAPMVTPAAYAQSAFQEQPQQLNQAQLAALVAPIALYPDPLISQILMASTYPLDVGEAYSWQKANSELTGDALNQALQQQRWDPSVKSLVSFPPVLGMMGSELSWTHQLGDAVLAQQSDVMNAIQELRVKAQASGALQSNAQQTVSTQGTGASQVIVIQPTNPQLIYVPTYDPWYVYGGWLYPAYPPYAFYPPRYIRGTGLLSFGTGMFIGAALWGGIYWAGRGWGGRNTLVVNNTVYNTFNRTTSNSYTTIPRSGASSWTPNQQRRNTNLRGSSVGSVSDSGRNAQREALRQNMPAEHMNGGQRGGAHDVTQMRGTAREAAAREQLRQNLRQSQANRGARPGSPQSQGMNGGSRSVGAPVNNGAGRGGVRMNGGSNGAVYRGGQTSSVPATGNSRPAGNTYQHSAHGNFGGNYFVGGGRH